MRITILLKYLYCIFITISVCFASWQAKAQYYYIDFEGSGASNQVDSVRVKNITQETTLAMNGADTLFLFGTVGIEDSYATTQNKIILYPNPTSNYSRFKVTVPTPGEYKINISGTNGQLITGLEIVLGTGAHEFEVSGLSSGQYFLQFLNGQQSIGGKLIITGSQHSNPEIRKIDETPLIHKKTTKAGRGVVEMQYNHGDQLLFICYAGNYSVVVPLIATENKTVNAVFVPCTDGQGIHYPVVHIGSQTWMARNLETTKYADGSNIPQVLNSTQWHNLSTGAYCWYDNNALNKWIYGALYNWYATNPGTNGNKNLCPEGWRVPSRGDFDILNNFLGYYWTNGGKLKETGFTHWNPPNLGAANSVGFTGLPGGIRSYGTFDELGKLCSMWTTTESSSWSYPYSRGLRNDTESFSLGVAPKHTGMSVRCIKNQ